MIKVSQVKTNLFDYNINLITKQKYKLYNEKYPWEFFNLSSITSYERIMKNYIRTKIVFFFFLKDKTDSIETKKHQSYD